MIKVVDGYVLKDGGTIGTVDGDAVIVPAKLHHKVQAQVERETGLKVVVRDDLNTAEVIASASNSSPALRPETQGLAPKSGEILSTPADIGITISGQNDTSAGIPADPTSSEPEPPQDHRGDKTPAYVDWLFRNRPEEAETRYANRVVSR